MPTTLFQEKVYAVTKLIPKGKVCTYKSLAIFLGSHPRAVGQALRKNPYAPEVPCHRVVSSDLSLGGFKGHTGGKFLAEKKKLLQEEGVRLMKDKVFHQYKFEFSCEQEPRSQDIQHVVEL